MKLYNTLTKKIEKFSPDEVSKVRMYSCGPTVYDYVHIGNLRSFVAADTLKRALLANDYAVTHIMNITDVDDKTIRRALSAKKDDPKAALKDITTKYENAFYDDIKKMNILSKDMTFVRATDSITAIKTLISSLVDGGFAYTTNDGVYFSIEAYKKSGKNYGQLINITAQNTSQARVDNDEYEKDSVHDFALWKVAKSGEPSWDFKLNGRNLDGRPGWHIECSAMSTMKLGQPFDIHTGGVDLLFPHHENEIAQSTAGRQDPIYAKYFVHSEHLLVEGKKMSKSLNNFYTLKSITDQGYDPHDLRLLYLQSHYRHQADFSFCSLKAASSRLENWHSLAVLMYQPIEAQTSISTKLNEFHKTVINHINNDLDTPQVLAAIDTLFSGLTEGFPAKDVPQFVQVLKFIDELLGLDLHSTKDISDSAKELIAKRGTARDNKDWKSSDAIREELIKQHIQLRDTPNGQIWSWLKR